jgi:anti-anti-sigma regulatory factor
MAKGGSGRGFLAKVMQFVRHPTTNWAELDAAADARQDEQRRKAALRQMVERKRRDDFVRRREFAMLRQLRRRGDDGGRSSVGVEHSSFHSSLPSELDDRTITLRKIDEIEAEMSMQWWAREHAGGAGVPAHARSVDRRPAESPLPAPSPVDEAGAAPGTALVDGAAAVEAPGQDPDVEEAAIRFANGDDVGAERALRRALHDDASGRAEAWLALFDLYRATGQQAAFETLAVDYAGRLGRAAPSWVDLPAVVAQRAEQVPAVGAPAVWGCPAVLDAQAMAALVQALQHAPEPWVLDWSALASIDAQAVPALVACFEAWAEREVVLHFVGARHLRGVLEAQTQVGRREAEASWWTLRMAALRAMDQPDEFERAALDYCLTYEVAPPEWRAPRCRCRALGEGEDATVVPAEPAPGRGPLSTIADATLQASVMPGGRQVARATLSGEVVGDAQGVLARLDAWLDGADLRVVSCRHLIRIDFAAAGSLLNWVAAHRAEGRAVRFVDAHRLVAAFFHVVGITEHARVLRRLD